MSAFNVGSSSMCVEVEERLSEVLEGSAPATLYDHIAECDVCRDRRHDAGRAAEIVAGAGADFRPAGDFAEQVLARVKAARPRAPAGGPAASSAGMPEGASKGMPEAASEGVPEAASAGAPEAASAGVPTTQEAPPAASAAVTEAAGAAPAGDGASAGQGTVVIDPFAADPGLATNPTVLAPIAVTTTQRPPSSTTDEGALPRENDLAGSPGGQGGSDATPREPSPPAATIRAPSSPVTAKSHHGVESARGEEGLDAPSASPTVAATAPPAASTSTDASPRKDAEKKKVVPLFRRAPIVAGIIGAAAAAAAVGVVVLKNRSSDPSTAVVDAPWSGKVTAVSRASADKTGGLEACDAAGVCAAVAAGAEVKPGTALRTDARTRAYVALADGTEVALDRDTRFVLSAKKDRTARLEQGTVVAEVASASGAAPARFWMPQGDVEVVGTKLSLTTGSERGSVEVARGSVRVTGRSGASVEVRAGEEATLGRAGDTVVASSTSLSDVMEWSDRTAEEVDAPVLRGLGELRARKPGQTKERDRAVRLAKHAVKVRIVDVVARTEVDETFANDTDEELEGIFRFPLPPGAQIERLALEVDGKLIEGAFVDRDRGAAIWRGVIQNAAPKAPRPREEIIWVPGPWRDPALLEWQRGGRFELRIFPIPKRGSRRVVLTYTQVVEQAAGVRRFTYPLAHDASGTTKIDTFDLDLQVLGLDTSFGLQTRGYELATASSDASAERRTMSATGFTPAGDLTVEFALPDRDRQATAWAYKMASAPPSPSTASSPAESGAAKAKTAEEKAAIDAASAIASDASPYVAIALRPKLPRWQEAKERVHAIVVDSSRSMVGERFARATRLASSIVREMDRRDAFVLLACDSVCRPMPAADGGGTGPSAPGAAAAAEVERFLGGVEPDGGSDLATSMLAARAALRAQSDKELRILYLGDGTPTVGPTRASHIETAVKGAMPSGDSAVVAVALGADADMASLQALARGGGGVVVPYVPGQKLSSAALDVLGAAYGVVLRDPEVELPAGLTQVTPARLDPIRSGGEAFIVARMSGGSELGGSIRLKGRVAGERFEQTYPVKVLATESAGNAFVPRLYAAAKIAELERIGGESQKPTIIELSKRFAVASRFTSLLVLESEAMFKAFGLDRGNVAPTFTGEAQAQSSSADAEGAEAEADDAAADKNSAGHGRLGPLSTGAARSFDSKGFAEGAPAGRGVVGGSSGPVPDAAKPARPSPSSAPMATAAPPRDDAPMSPPPSFEPAPPPAKKKVTVAGDPLDPFSSSWDERRARRMVPMRRIFERKGGFEAVNTLAQQNATKLLVAESARADAPDSRDKTVELYALYATSGRIGEAQELTARWSGRDALDPDALTARADLAARQGDRDRAIRILGGLADVRPADRATQTRLADLQEAAGNQALACEHRIALAGLTLSDAKVVAGAVRCARAQGMNELASQIRLDTTDKVREAVDKILTTEPASSSSTTAALAGDVQISAQWSGGADLDIALIDAQGRRISWLGSPIKAAVSSRDATSSRSETLALRNLPAGSYVIEISRAAGADANVFVQGDVTIKLVDETRKVPFSLSGPRVEIGTGRVFFTSRLVPAESLFFGGWR